MKEYRWTDRKDWGEGPWKDEPDKIQWVDEETGLDCLMHRHQFMGHWCGYVGVAEGHPLFGKDYEQADNLEVHGGITFGDYCDEGEDPAHGICHVPEEGRPERVYWLGFDCGHYHDEAPYMIHEKRPGGHRHDLALHSPGYRECRKYRDMAFVKAECKALAKQLKALA